MKRIIAVAALVALTVTSCAATHYSVRPVTGYVQPNDDAGASCATPLLIPVPAADSVWARCEWRQSGSLLKADSSRSPRAAFVTFQPPVEVPNATQVTVTLWLRDVGGTSCPASFLQTPSQVLVKPAAFSGLAIVP